MKLRFKLRTLLIATALVGLFLGLQVHVHNKAKRFMEEMNGEPSVAHRRLLRDASLFEDRHNESIALDPRYSIWAELEPMTFTDFMMFRRRGFVRFISHPKNDSSILTAHLHHYRLHVFGERRNLKKDPRWLLLDENMLKPITDPSQENLVPVSVQ